MAGLARKASVALKLLDYDSLSIASQRLSEFDSSGDGEQHPPNLVKDGGRKWRQCQLTKASNYLFQNFFSLNRCHLGCLTRTKPDRRLLLGSQTVVGFTVQPSSEEEKEGRGKKI
ncbi:unnamed protein product [Prunus armeniaca]|uniref:Uncharacterized protein n=1 Tax=Prunus armeniaca TaxID=36596 RepID=A0A6J5VN17_PRUAR|nr:unnamed protein product [Prunus armeniaca]